VAGVIGGRSQVKAPARGKEDVSMNGAGGGGTAEVADVAIIGAGVVGTAIARTLAGYELSCVLIEAGDDVGTGTSKANTAILHTGFDTEPGSLESRLLRRGAGLLRDYARQSGIAVERTGALVVAWTEDEEQALAGIEDKARRNGCGDIRRRSGAEIYQSQPHLGAGARAGLEIPGESIICPWTTPLAFATEAVRAGVRLRLRTRVTGVRPAGRVTGVNRRTSGEGGEAVGGKRVAGVGGPGGGAEHQVETSRGPLRCRWLINAAGLESDRIDRMLGGDGFTISPRRGELIVFDKLARPLVSSIVLPVPTARSKGVLVAPTVYGNILLGPTADDVPGRTDTATTAVGLAGLLRAGRRILPDLVAEEVTATYAGLRAATEHRDYQIRVDEQRRYACVAGIRSTGLSASLGIAEYVVDLLGAAGLKLTERATAGPPAMPYLGQAGMRPYQDAARIAADPEYGRIVCHCERVTRGEIRDALASTLPPASLDGLRRRTRAVNGRCQGFYCAACVAQLLESGLPDAGLAAT
jgi:glycerol-3-phosphate dehydrogenase